VEHGREECGLVVREGEMGTADVLEGGERRGAPVIPGACELGAEALESLARDVGDEILAVAIVPVGCGRAHSRGARRLREGEARQPALGDEIERRPDQRLAQIAVMIAAPAWRWAMSRPAPGRISYMNRAGRGRGG